MSESTIAIIFGVVCMVVVGAMFLYTGASVSNTINDLQSLEYQQCQTIPVSDKFTTITGGALSVSTRYYITSDSKTYDLIIGSNPDDIQKFRNINGTVDVKTYKSNAAFCNYKLMEEQL